MKREIYVYSTILNGDFDSTKRFFKKTFNVKKSLTPPAIGSFITIGCLTIPSDWDRLKEGAVANVKTSHSTQQIWVEFMGTEMSTEDLRDYLTPAKGWKEISGKLE